MYFIGDKSLSENLNICFRYTILYLSLQNILPSLSHCLMPTEYSYLFFYKYTLQIYDTLPPCGSK